MYARLVCVPIIIILCCISAFADLATIPPGGEVYLGEEGLDIHLAVPYPYTSIAYFPPGSSPGRDQPLDIMQINQGRFSIIPDLFIDRTGAWYQWDQVRGVPGQVAFIVRSPRITLKIMDQNTMGDRSYGTVPRGTALVIQVETNLAGITRRPGYSYNDGPVKIQIKTPGGGTLSGVTTPGGGQYLFSSFMPTGELGYAPPIETGGWDTGGKGYESGLYYIEPQFAANRMEDNLRSYPGGYTLRGSEITLGTERAGLSLSSESVVRGNPFAVTITGTPGSPYILWIEGGSRSGLSGDQPPMILTSQEGIRQDDPSGPYRIGSYRPYRKSQTIHEIVPAFPYSGVYYYAEVTPDRNGRRTVEFRTTRETDDREFTIHVEGPAGSSYPKSDDIRVRVIKGDVSLSARSDTFTIGEEIRLSGVNSGSCETYLFMTGPNLPSAGGRLDAPRRAVVQGDPGSFTVADGDCETWDYRFFTGDIGVDTGTYTVYAVSSPSDRYHLGSSTWQAIPITLTRPYVSVSGRRMTVAQGDDITITGSSGGSPDAGVAIWIFGRNYFLYDTVQTERGGQIFYDLTGAVTSTMAPGEYLVIVQHPMANGNFDLWPDRNREMVLGTTPWYGSPVFRVGGPGALQGPAAASALITALSSQYIDDTYTEYSIFIQNPKISILADSLNATTGDLITLSGKTNLAPGSRMLVEITDERFSPTPKGYSGEWAGYSGTTTTIAGPDGEQEFFFEIPVGTLPAGRYHVLVQAVSSAGTASGDLIVSVPVQTILPTITAPDITENVTPPEMALPAQTAEIVPPATIMPPITPIPVPVATEKGLTVQGVVSRIQDPPVLLGIGVLVGILIAGLVVLILAMVRRKNEMDAEDIKEPEEDGAEPDDLKGTESEYEAEE